MKEAEVVIDFYYQTVTEAEGQGSTAMFITKNSKLTGIIATVDTLKDNAIEALSLLKKSEKELIMLTGDNQRVADAIAKEVSIDFVCAQVHPNKKQKSEEL